jgi:hypothetical protein
VESSVLRLREGATSWSVVDSEAIVLDLSTQMYSGLNPVGTLAWSLLANGVTRERLIEEVCNHFSVSADDAARDIETFLQDCRARGYLDEASDEES